MPGKQLVSACEASKAAHSDALIDCHALESGEGAMWQCAGSSIYRANVAKRSRNPEVLVLPPDRERVFNNPGEFAAHHQPSTPPRSKRRKENA